MSVGYEEKVAMLDELEINIGDTIHIRIDLLSDGSERNKYGIDVPTNMKRLIAGQEFLVVDRDSFLNDDETMVSCRDSNKDYMLVRDREENTWYVTGAMIDSVYNTEDVYEVESIDVLFGV